MVRPSTLQAFASDELEVSSSTMPFLHAYLGRFRILEAKFVLLYPNPALERTRTPLYSVVVRCIHCTLPSIALTRCPEDATQHRIPALRLVYFIP